MRNLQKKPASSSSLRTALCTLSLAAFAVVPSHAQAAGCAPGFQDAGASRCTATFVYSGAPQTVTLPAETRGVIVTASGAEGGTSKEEQVDPFGGAPSPGGMGGRQTATIPVAGSALLTVVVGQMGTGGSLGTGYGGYGGGGHTSSTYGGNGGGGSFVFDVDGPLIAAGGGGGGGYDYNPVVMGHGDQQNPGGNGSGASAAGDGASVPFCCDGTAPYRAVGGGGATPAGGGAGGHPTLPPSYAFGQADGDWGSGPAIDANNFGNGGNTHNGCCYFMGWAGGGGGGYYGGGGGGSIEAHLQGGGGGGGAGYVIPGGWGATSQTGVQLGDGEVTISYYTGTCNPACVTCTGPLATNCSSCAAGLVISEGSCVVATTTTTSTTTTTTTTTSTMLTPICDVVPATGCKQVSAGTALLKMRDDPDNARDQLKWRWGHGDATPIDAFLDPTSGSEAYVTCVYDSSANGQPLVRMNLGAGGNCDMGLCWKATSKGFLYRNKSGTSDGVTLMKLLSGLDGQACIQVKGKGDRLPPLMLGLTLPVTVQLMITDGVTTGCWQTVFTDASKNDASMFVATGP